MAPQPGGFTPLLSAVRDRLEERLGVRYDSVLVNLYPDGKSGMRFHSDPLYAEWSADTAIVSIGCARTLVFRDVDDFDRRYGRPSVGVHFGCAATMCPSEECR